MLLSALDLVQDPACRQLSLTAGHAGYRSIAQKLSNPLFKDGPDLSLSTGIREMTTVGLYQAVQDRAPTLKGAHHLSQIYVRRIHCQRMSALRATTAPDKTSLVKGRKDLIKVALWNPLASGYFGGLHRRVIITLGQFY